MGRYIVKWYEKVRRVGDYPSYMGCETECFSKNEAEGLFDWLLYCKSSVRNVSIYDKESKKTIRRK